jgi:hypothetical protein
MNIAFQPDRGNTWLRGVFVSVFDGLKVGPPGAPRGCVSTQTT